MAREIERKFLVDGDGWKDGAEKGVRLKQAYLLGATDRSARVRIFDGARARITLKFGAGAMSRDEFEYDVPLDDALEMIAYALGTVIDKTRYRVPAGDFVWEIDVYHQDLAGLVVAEVELPNEAARPHLPDWLGREVTGDGRYTNQALAETGTIPEEDG
ncbi:CYTH domain-containing protein [Martelella lutilitoris]|uniref:CYTH domain-containing protein n=1 Tax=Martelella lutilitoris TaxID=2583532 RepID=A0A7T7HKE9_9HYPH|nr:CYTH domain-containing protein [Martelella lutilitoris]QQM30803.1 CYTH domain-containing protein [Martelella lutilitoris]